MVIVTILMGSAFLLFSKNDDSALEKLSRETQILAKETLRSAKQEQRPYYVILSHDSIWAETDVDTQALSDSSPAQNSRVINIDPGITLSYRYITESDWTTISKGQEPLVWTFAKSGLCQQISLRFSTDDGVTEATFHPLTAGLTIDEN